MYINPAATTVVEVQYEIDVVNATKAVKALTNGEKLATGVNQDTITAASSLVEALPADVAPSTTKANLQAAVKTAQGYQDVKVANANATAAVNGLFVDPTAKTLVLASNVDQAKIESVTKTVSALVDEDVKGTLTDTIAVAQDFTECTCSNFCCKCIICRCDSYKTCFSKWSNSKIN